MELIYGRLTYYHAIRVVLGIETVLCKTGEYDDNALIMRSLKAESGNLNVAHAINSKRVGIIICLRL